MAEKAFDDPKVNLAHVQHVTPGSQEGDVSGVK